MRERVIRLVDEEWMEGPFDGYPKMKGPLPTVWLEIKPGVFWYKYKESALRVDSAWSYEGSGTDKGKGTTGL